MLKSMKKSVKLFDTLRRSRRHASKPHNDAEAAKLRASKDWQIADSSFKLLGKFGYLAILKSFKTIVISIDDGTL